MSHVPRSVGRAAGGRLLAAVCLFACHSSPPTGAAMPPSAPHPPVTSHPVEGDATPPSTLRQRYGLHGPTAIAPARTALVLVDVQREFLDGQLRLPDSWAAVDRAQQLLAWARGTGVGVVFVRQQAAAAGAPLFAPGSTGAELAAGFDPRPDEIVITKSAAGAFSRTALHQILAERGIELLIIAGMMTHLAVDTTARDATVLGYRAVIAGDATATRSLPGPHGDGIVDHATLQRAALAALADRFADIAATEEIIALPVRR
ncbi:MAG: isochorismatase family protein [Deltaproteobacteria bacterium]|nr:MAG: isochorismatase family protein [Deltaproteobacteria bacterium]